MSKDQKEDAALLELAAMKKIAKTLAGLPNLDARDRVVAWVEKAFGPQSDATKGKGGGE